MMSFTFVLNSGTLTITGSDSAASSDADQIQITQNGSAITATDIRTGAAQTANSGVTKIVVDLRAGDDYVRLRNNDGTKPVIFNTTIFGGLGNDTIYGGDVNDNLSGGDGDDKLQGRGGSDVYDGGAGFDTADYSYETRAISVSLDGLTNDGVINVGNGSSELDTVQNTIEAVVGGSGNDTLIGNSSANFLDGGAGNDAIAGLLGNDTVTGGLGIDTVLGNEGNDFLFAKDGIADAINAGTGTDSAQVDTSPKDVATAAATVSNPVSALAVLQALGAPATYFVPQFSSPVANNPSDLDTSFGNFDIGTTIDNFGVSNLHITKALQQRVNLGDNFFENRLLLIGYAQNESGNSDFFVGRLTVDGRVDTSFGESSGYTLTNIGPSGAATNDFANDAILDNSGNIVLAGSSGSDSGQDFALSRYNSDGQLDLSFGGINSPATDDAGTVLKNYGYDDSFNGIVDYYNGVTEAYYVIGSSNGISVVYGFSPSGSDASGFTPIQIYQDGPIYAGVDLALDSSGNLWTLSSVTGGSNKAYVAGFDKFGNSLVGNSTLEINYGAEGYDSFSPSALGIRNFFGTDLLYVVGSGTNTYSAGTLAEAEITYSFNGEGYDNNISLQHSRVINSPFVESSLAFSDVSFDNTERVVVTGTQSGSGPSNFYTARFTNELQNDDTFNGGNQNYVTTQVGDSSSAASVIAPDGIYVAGTVFNNNESTSAGVVKYGGGELVVPPPIVDAPPELDPTFGPGGNPAGTIRQLFGQEVTINDVAIQNVYDSNSDSYVDKILLAGSIGAPLQANDGGRIDDFVMRLNADGSLDTTFGYEGDFGGAGYYSVDFGDFNNQRADYVNKIVVNPDQTITLLGTSYASDYNNAQSDGEVTIARLTQDGLLDLTFGATDGFGGHTGKNRVDLAANSSEKLVDVVVQTVTVGADIAYQYVVLAEGQNGGRTAAYLTRWTTDGLTTAFNLSSFFDPSAEIIPVAAGADSGGNLWFLAQNFNVNGTHLTLERTDSNGIVAGGAYIGDPFGSIVGSNYTVTDMVIGPDDKVYITANVDTDGTSYGGIIAAQIVGSGLAVDDSTLVSSPIPTNDGDPIVFNEATLDSEGRLLVSGTVNFGDDVMLYRTNVGGLSADITYGDNGFVYYSNRGAFNSGPHIGGIVVQPDGKIVIGGDAIYRKDSGLDSLEAAFAARFDPTSVGVTDGVENLLPDDFDPSTLKIDDPDNASDGNGLPDYLIADLVPPTQAQPLTITGTTNDDSITVTQIVGQNGEALVQVKVNTDVTTYDPANISEYIIDGFGGTDSINFSPAVHLPLSITGEDGFTLRIGSSPDEFGQVEPITSVTSSNGAAQLFDNGTPETADDYILYTPTNGSFGPDSFSYTVGAPQGAAPLIAFSPAEITVNIDLISANDAPVAGEDTLADSAEDTIRTIFKSTLLSNDSAGPSNESGQTITITGVSDSVGGTAVLLANGNVQFNPTANYNGPASFKYTITDNGTTNGVADPLSATTTATFNITEVNDAPVASPDPLAAIAEDSGNYTIAFSTLLGNDSKGPANESGQTLTITGVSNAVGGTVQIVGTNVIFSPGADFNGPASFKYTVSDDGTTNGALDFKTAIGSASFSVTPVNDKPTANAGGPYSVTAGQTVQLSGSATDVDLPNDTLTYSWDLDGDGIFGETGIAATRGTETGATPTFSSAGLTGPSTFAVSLKVTDSGNLSDTKSVNITINPASDTTKLTGTVIGTTGSYKNNGNTREKAFDGNANTFFQPPQDSNLFAWIGLDFGAATPKTITQIKLLPKAGTSGTLVLGQVQASNDPTFKTGVTVLYTLLTVSSSGYTTINISNPNGFRALRFVGTIGSNFNIAEMEVYGKTPVPDTVKPTKPGKPAASSIGFTSLKLNWAASTDAYGVSGYNIYRDGNLVGTSTNTSYTDTNLKPGTTYSYAVRAFDAVPNISDASDALSVKTTVDSTPPTKPGTPKASSITRTTLTLSWGASSDNVGVVKYYIYQNGVKVGESATLSFNVINLTRNTSYAFTVAALDVTGNLSVLSNPLTAKTSN